MYKGLNTGKTYGGYSGLTNRWISVALQHEIDPTIDQSPNYPFKIKSAVAAISTKVNIGGVWKSVSARYVNVGGVWKSVVAISANVGGVWKSEV